jgi:2-phosphoglycerate kinase
MSETEDRLKRVFWLGGSPCAGKSSISEILASRFDMDVYHVDEAFEIHRQELNPAQQPTLTKWLASPWNERWMRPVDSLVEDVISCYREHFDLVRQDILARPQRKSLLVEGTALLPREIANIMPNRSHAIWIIPTPDFQREHYSLREWARKIVEQCNDPEVAFQNWMERDIRFAEWIEAEVSTLDLQLLRIDGSRTIAEHAEEVAGHFHLLADAIRD